ncbi:MAG: sugar O-acyltransferase [Bacteroidota bacterium]
MAKQVIIIGGQGNGGVAAACIQDMRMNYDIDEYEVYGFLNDFEEKGGAINGYPVLGGLKDIETYLAGNFYFIYAIHSISHAPLRLKIFKSLNIPDEKLITLIHPLTFIGEGTTLEPGVMVMAHSYIGPETKVGKCTFIMANCAIGHNNTIGGFCHFSVGAICSSILTIGEGCDVALNATVMEKVTMGNYSVVGAGALCLKDVEPYQVVVGSPAKHLKYVKPEETQDEWKGRG